MKEKINFYFALIVLFATSSIFSDLSDCTNWNLKWQKGDQCKIDDMICTRENGEVINCGGACPKEYRIRAIDGNIDFCYKSVSECKAQNYAQRDHACPPNCEDKGSQNSDKCTSGELTCTVKNPGSAIYCNGKCPKEYSVKANGGNLNYCYKSVPECKKQNYAQADWACECPPRSKLNISKYDCYNFNCESGYLAAICLTGDDGAVWRYSKINIGSCSQEIQNCRGTLTCGPCS